MQDNLENYGNGLTLLEFTRQKLNYIEIYTNLIKSDQVNPEQFFFALATFTGVNSFLVTQQTLMENDYEKAKEEFDIIWKEWYLEARDRINVNRVASKLAANPEIEAEVVKEHHDEYLEWKDKLRLLEKKAIYYSRISKVWESQGKRLDTLGYGMGSELKAVGVESGHRKKRVKEIVVD